jgi:hypothetical protein
VLDLSKELYTAISIVISIASSYPYVRDVIRGTTKPHFFTWFIWGLVAAIIFVAMRIEGAGVGAWIVGFGAFKCLSFAGLALWRGEKTITRSDWWSFVACLTAIPIWMITRDPLWSVVWLVGIEAVAFFPTFRKSLHKPHEETISSYLWGVVQSILTLLAIERYAWVNMLYALSIIIQNGAFVLFVWWRRRN